MKVIIYEPVPRSATEDERTEIFNNGLRCIGSECFWHMHDIFAGVGKMDLLEQRLEYIKRCHRSRIYSSVATELLTIANKYTRCMIPKLNGMLVNDEIAVAFIDGYIEGIKQYDNRREEFSYECEDDSDL